MSVARHHAEWLSLVEISGPFLSLPVLLRVFPQQLESLDAGVSRDTRLAFAEWEDAEGDRAVHHAWLQFVLKRILSLPEEVLLTDQAIPPGMEFTVAEHGETLRPQWVVKRAEDERAALLVVSYPAAQDLDRTVNSARWQASPATRMLALLQGTGVPLGLVTNGSDWMLVASRPSEPATYVTWDAALWSEEPLTLRAFSSLMGAMRLFGVAERDRLPALLAESAQNQQEVTDQLGLQVRKAVEVLVQAVDRINADRNGQLLTGVGEKELYQAALTVMMRLVFVLSAEERGLLLLGDPLWNRHYAVSTLRDQLREVPDENLLAYRHDAWSRLLSTFRAIHAGVEHDQMRLPAYGGALFDPDRFPFLEGRQSGSHWQEVPAQPLPVSNRTVLHLLEALQFLQMRIPGGGAEPRRLSFRALDIEQIGHVYEGLLDHTARRAASTVLGLRGSGGDDVEVELSALEAKAAESEQALVDYLKERTGRSLAALRSDLRREEPPNALALQAVCAGHDGLYNRIARFAHLLRDDSSGHPVVIHTGSVYVTKGSDRRSTGTHYTPRTLTEEVVKTTLDPLLYTGVSQGIEPSPETLKTPTEILALKVCDPACGSGAFLVQTCRYMAERVVEGWAKAEAESGGSGPLTVPEALPAGASHSQQLLPPEPEERLALARRLVAERCLYGVDFNPMAVEMAKLSLWLVTLHKHRPFTFLDHAIKCGDSLLGLHDPAQLERFHLVPSRAQTRVVDYLLTEIQQLLAEARRKREALERFTALDVRDAELKAQLHREAENSLALVRVLADLIVGAALSSSSTSIERSAGLLDARLQDILLQASSVIGAIPASELAAERSARHEIWTLQGSAAAMIGSLPSTGEPRRPFHWIVEFPEVFGNGSVAGFDALVGNPPFQGGTLASTALGVEYTSIFHIWASPWHGKADLIAAFFRRAPLLLSQNGLYGFVSTSSVLRGETCDVSLQVLKDSGWNIFCATTPRMWPGTASTEFVTIFLSRNPSIERRLDGRKVAGISIRLEESTPHAQWEIFELQFNEQFGGLLGIKLSPANREISGPSLSEAREQLPALSEFLRPVIGGDELYSHFDWSRLKFAYDVPAQVIESLNSQHIRSLKHSAPAQKLRGLLESNRLAFACGETSVHLAFDWVPRSWILKHKLVVVCSRSFSLLGLLNSSIHAAWAWQEGLRREARLVYSPKRCFMTFPFPDRLEDDTELPLLAKALARARRAWKTENSLGLTELYNRVHDSTNFEPAIVRLRDLHVAIDAAVLRAYGWCEISLDHDFREVGYLPATDRVRFSIAEPARQEVIRKLSALNHQRHEIEDSAALRLQAALEQQSGVRRRAGRPAAKKTAAQTHLFD